MRGNDGKSPVATGRAWCAIIAFAGFVFSGCATIQSRASANPLGALGDGASLYLVLPVRGNESLLESVASRVMKEGDARAVIARTDALYAGVFFQAYRNWIVLAVFFRFGLQKIGRMGSREI